MTQSERELQNSICRYLRLKHPKAKFRTDKDGVFMVKSALRDKSIGSNTRGFPDIIIREKRKGYNALVIELKAEGVVVFNKDGTLRKDKHLEEQKEWLDWFGEMGCYSTFSIGWDETIELIDNYLL